MENFNIVSGNVYLCDPCYISEADDDATEYKQKAKNGTWVVDVECMETSCDYRIISFTAYHNDINVSDIIINIKKCGVDSGQFGIFDSSVGFSETFYNECCKLTISNICFGVLENNMGFVSSTGYGDGEYDLKMWIDKNTNEIVRINIEFIEEEYSDYYEGEDIFYDEEEDN